MEFAKNVWKLLVAIKDGLSLVFLLLFFALLFAILTARPNAAAIKEGALLMNLDGFIVEEPAPLDPFAVLFSGEAPTGEHDVQDVIHALETAAEDDRIKAVVLDLREFLGAAEQCGRLRRVKESVDPSWEPASIAKWMFLALPVAERFGLMFEDVVGARFPLVTGALGASIDTYALALQTKPDALNDKWLRGLANPHDPVRVNQAPCQENVQLGADATLAKIPVRTSQLSLSHKT